MGIKTLYLVGDKFINFTNGENILLASELLGKNDNSHLMQKKDNYVVCQGVNSRVFSAFSNLANIANRKVLERKEDKANVHKQYETNVMITIPEKLNDITYMGNLLLDNECIELSDHVTGKHISGMILIEAARQMMLATSERYFLPTSLCKNSYFVLNNINIKFLNFLFPLEVCIKCIVLDVEFSEKGSMKANFSIEFWQYGIVGAKVDITFSVYEKNFLTIKEGDAAKLVIKKLKLGVSNSHD